MVASSASFPRDTLDWPVPVLGASVVLPFAEPLLDVPVSLPASGLPAPLPAAESPVVS